MRATASVRGSERTTSARTDPSFSIRVAPHGDDGCDRSAPNEARLPMPVMASTPAAAQNIHSYLIATVRTAFAESGPGRVARARTVIAPPNAVAIAAT